MSSLRKSMDSLPFIVKLLLVLFLDPIYGGLYRFCKGETVNMVIGILWFVTVGAFGIGWIIDFVTMLLNKKITVLD
ncbi:MAG: hypothetical protein WDA00_04380 [Eubacteriales bacterium]